eukprot:7403181-Lingulodinium_polyedra.AAC.1
MARLNRAVLEYPRDPHARTDHEALLELLKRTSLYDAGESTVARFEWDKLNLLKGTVASAPLRDRLPPAARRIYDNAATEI